MEYSITTIKNYPENGKHQEVVWDLPFMIRKGEDGYCWSDKKGVEHKYNMAKNEKTTDLWICHIDGRAFPHGTSLEKYFDIKTNKDVEVLIAYCVKIYMKYLKNEVERVYTEYKKYL